MNYQEFITSIKDSIAKRLTEGRTVRIEQISKNNGMIYDGLIIIDPFINISPTIYLNHYYYQYLSGASVSDICDAIFSSYEKNLPTKDFDISIFKDFSKAKSHIAMKLVNYEKNKALLEHSPHIPYLDLAIIFVCCITEFKQDFATIQIQYKHMDFWKIGTNELYEIAKKNTPLLLPPLLEHMKNSLHNFIDEKETDISNFQELPLYILTNERKINGATTILYENVLKEFAQEQNSDLIVLPSSIHEVILLPANENTLKNFDYNRMIREVNATQLAGDEILSDHAYYYSREKNTLFHYDHTQ